MEMEFECREAAIAWICSNQLGRRNITEETRKFLETSFRDGEVKTVGTDIDKLMPPVSRFGSGNREKKKQGIIDKLKAFFEKYFGIGGPARFTPSVYDNNIHEDVQDMVAEGQAKY